MSPKGQRIAKAVSEALRDGKTINIKIDGDFRVTVKVSTELVGHYADVYTAIEEFGLGHLLEKAD